MDSLFHMVGKEDNGNLLANWERHLVTYNKSDCLVIRAFSMSRLNLNVLWNEIGSLFALLILRIARFCNIIEDFNVGFYV